MAIGVPDAVPYLRCLKRELGREGEKEAVAKLEQRARLIAPVADHSLQVGKCDFRQPEASSSHRNRAL
jgi:hypothetical protein